MVRRSTANGSVRAAAPQGPTGTIRGLVVDAASGAPLEGVIVQVQGSSHKVRTDAKGAFALDGIPSGRQTLYVSLIGYALARPTTEVKPGETAELRVPLAPGTSSYNETVTVRPDSRNDRDVTVPSYQWIGNAEIQHLRGVLADDPIRAVHALPGVAANDDFRSEFSVRAADFAHLGVSIDGVSVPWPLHSVRGSEDTGSIAMINSDVLDHVALASGAYPQRAGSTTGAWVDFGLREGSRSAFGLHGAVSATSASAVLEGPIAGGRGSWIASIRKSYLDWLLRALDFEETTTFGFLDHQSKVVFDLTSRHQLEFSAVAGRSGLVETEVNPSPNSIMDGDSDTAVVTTGVRSVFGRTVLRQRVSFITLGFDNRGDFGQPLDNGSFRDLGYRAGLSFAPARASTIEIGGEIRRERESRTLLAYEFAPQAPQTIVRSVQTFDGSSWLQAGYVHVLWNPSDRWSVSPGVRVAHSTLTNETIASPWVQGLLRFGQTSLRAGVGLHQQFPRFDQVLGQIGNPALTRERARHLDVGIEQRLGGGFRWQATFYDRDERDMIRLENAEPRLVNGIILFPGPIRFANALTGSSRGVELSLARSDPNGLSGWISYAYGRATYDDAITGESYWGDFDQRHTVNIYGQYRLTGRTNVSVKFRAGSNVPVAGYFVERDGGLFLSDQRNDVRLPTYARLDLRADRTFHFTRRRLTLYVEVLNVLDRTNLGPADGTVRVRTQEALGFVEQLFPLLPAAGFLIEF